MAPTIMTSLAAKAGARRMSISTGAEAVPSRS